MDRAVPASRAFIKEMLRGRGRGPLRVAGVFHLQHIRDGEIIDEFDAPNVVTDEGVNYGLDVSLSAGTQITSWYLALKDNTGDPVDGSETYATPVFSEITAYSEANRPAWTDGGVSAKSVDNSGSPADFSITSSVTVYGVSLVGGGSTPSTKGDTAGGGKMWSVGNFTGGSKDLTNGDTLRVTYTLTGDDDGV
jgi:hypothetical protein